MGLSERRGRLLLGLLAAVGLLLAGSVPAVGQEGGTVSAQVTMAQADEICVLIGVAELDFGTLGFDAGADSDRYAVESCSTADQQLYAQATDASGDGEPVAQWGLVEGAGVRQTDEFAVDAELEGIGDAWLGVTPAVIGTLPAGTTTQAGHQLVMAPAGSSGAGQSMTFDITWTATLDETADPTWTQQTVGPGTDALWDVTFVNRDRGWAVGSTINSTAVIFATSDGGATWTRQTPQDGTGPVQALGAVSFVDANRGWAIGPQTLLATTDGGVTWVVQETFSGIGHTDVEFIDANRGWMTANLGRVSRTGNGGDNWTTTQPAFSNLTDVMFIDPDRGWVVGSGGTILTTGNGGTNWTEQPSGTSQALRAVTFVDSERGWAVGNDGTILRTANGGATWTAQPSGVSGDALTAVAFVDANRGWVVGGTGGGSGFVLSTIDGGATWTRQDFARPLDGVDFVDARTGWAVGEGGSILSYR
jgi:photosystem II stability/assembly factor-like uncharacterized protein